MRFRYFRHRCGLARFRDCRPTSWGKAKGFSITWVEFTDRWRLGYRPAMDKVRRREIPWTNLDDLDRMILEDLLKEYKIEGLSEEEKVNWTHVWRRLEHGQTPSRGSFD